MIDSKTNRSDPDAEPWVGPPTEDEWLWTVEAKTSNSAIDIPVKWPAVGRHRAEAKRNLAAAFPIGVEVVEWGETYIE